MGSFYVNTTMIFCRPSYNSFEFVVRAILGQQISIKAATTLAARLVEKVNLMTDSNFPDGLAYFFPTPEELLNVKLDGIGISNSKQFTIHAVTEEIITKNLQLTANQSFEEFYQTFSAIKGIGDWTVNYVAMRGLGDERLLSSF